MIRKPNNWNEVLEFTDRHKLPLDAYVCRVKKAVVQDNGYGEQLCLLFDIVEGEYRNFYENDFKSNTQADKKWRGVLRQFIPKDDGSEKDEWTKSSFKGMCTCFEKSNPGYVWNWDETSLVGKLVGILFRNEEYDFNGKQGWAVRPFRAISVDSVRSGDFTLPKDKPLKKETDPSVTRYGDSFVGDSYSDTGDSYAGFTELSDDNSKLPF